LKTASPCLYAVGEGGRVSFPNLWKEELAEALLHPRFLASSPFENNGKICTEETVTYYLRQQRHGKSEEAHTSTQCRMDDMCTANTFLSHN
jgi:hypothetical protein